MLPPSCPAAPVPGADRLVLTDLIAGTHVQPALRVDQPFDKSPQWRHSGTAHPIRGLKPPTLAGRIEIARCGSRFHFRPARRRAFNPR